ncbi:hypothetical protein Tco_1053927 [Tanacetum coccineum]|uniref:Uncharacterized protein n=1 Tax=Tanacetum coccineum TaxID=301880 RepID=A0ABQ5GVY9_9ASTR
MKRKHDGSVMKMMKMKRRPSSCIKTNPQCKDPKVVLKLGKSEPVKIQLQEPTDKVIMDEQPTKDIPIFYEGHVSDPEDTDNAHMPKIPDTTTWFRPMPEEERPASPELEWFYNEYKISEKDFKSLHPNDFEDLNILHIQGKLDHLPKQDKVNLYNAVNLWTRNIVIRKRVEDLQLGIESYQTKLNLEQPNWDASDFPFKEDYTIVFKPRAVIYRDRDDNRKMMRINEVHKFSDGTLTRIKEKLDFMVKDFKLFKFNKGMENRKWTKDDKRRSEDFIEVIERRLKIRRIFQSLESFVGGRLRDIDYRLINRTE